MKRYKFEKSFNNRDKLPFDAPRLALALKHLYDEFKANPDRKPVPIHTQIENPDPHKPQNPSVKSEPSLNNRAAVPASPIILNASLGARPIPI